MGRGGGGGEPSSSAAGGQNDDEDDDAPVTVVWGTTVTLQESMSAFKWFLEEFKAGDRHDFDMRRYNDLEGDAGSQAAIEYGHSKERAEKKMYQFYMERMRETGQTNLNLDMTDLVAFRSLEREDIMASKKDKQFGKLWRNLALYPQEIIPILDQVLKDCALDWAWSHLGNGEDRAENEQRARAMDTAVFKVRPFGLTKVTNMRELNPQGSFSLPFFSGQVLVQLLTIFT